MCPASQTLEDLQVPSVTPLAHRDSALFGVRPRGGGSDIATHLPKSDARTLRASRETFELESDTIAQHFLLGVLLAAKKAGKV